MSVPIGGTSDDPERQRQSQRQSYSRSVTAPHHLKDPDAEDPSLYDRRSQHNHMSVPKGRQSPAASFSDMHESDEITAKKLREELSKWSFKNWDKADTKDFDGLPDAHERKREQKLGPDEAYLRACCMHHSPWLRRLKAEIFLIFEYPTSSITATFFSVFLFLCVITSVCGVVIETLPEFHDPDFWHIFDGVFSIIFTVEYCLRLWVCKMSGVTRWHFVFRFLNICDILAVLPFYLELIFKAANVQDTGQVSGVLRILRAMRLTRVARLFKLGKFTGGISLKKNLANNIFGFLARCEEKFRI